MNRYSEESSPKISIVPATVGDIPPAVEVPDIDETAAEKQIEERYSVGTVLAHASAIFVYEKVNIQLIYSITKLYNA